MASGKDITEIKETDIWTLYDESVSYCRMLGMYGDTDLNYRMYNGDQWYGLKVEGIEKVQFNFIKPIVRYKTGIILSNLYAINYSSGNFENRSFRDTAKEICELLNKKVARLWEKDYLDMKLRLVLKDAAVNDEGIIYVYTDKDGDPINEIINKTDVYYGNENDSDIQSQPYILIKQRRPVSEVQAIAEMNGVSSEQIQHILGDMDNIEEAGESAKYEKDDMCTMVTKMYKEDGTVHFAQSTRYVEIKKDSDTGLTYYPVAHLIWEEKKGSARGEGEVRHLIPNQLETNKTAMRRVLAVKNTAFPQKVVNIDQITNPSALDAVGGIVKVSGGLTVDDVSKVFSYINPAQMSPEVEKLQQELISSTRELAGAGEIATGDISPESASGRAILAVQRAAQQPLTEHLEYTKAFIEDLARIWLDILIVYNDSIQLEREETDPMSGEPVTVLVEVLKDTLTELQASVKVDITPKSAYDKFAQEQSLENLLTSGMLNPQNLSQLKLYVRLLDDDSVMPKQKLEELIEYWEEEQRKIAMINNRAQMMQQRVQQFLMEDPEGQASQMASIMSAQNRMPSGAVATAPAGGNINNDELQLEELVEIE